MIQRETAEPVVQYLRAMTYDGVLPSDEVGEWANWLNQQPDKIVESWPAKPLVAALRAAYADKKVTEAELEELAQTIAAIEELWAETFPQTPDEETADDFLAGAAM